MKKKKLVKKVKQLKNSLSDVLIELHDLSCCYSDHMQAYHGTDLTNDDPRKTNYNAEEEK